MVRNVLVVLALAIGLAAADFSEISQVPMPDGRIVGGFDTDIIKFPHQISMRYKGRHRCGGSILTPSLIISASHCVTGVDASLLTIVAGSTLLSEEGQEIPVETYIMHEKYSSLNNDYDVAILVLRGSFQLNDKIQPIALAKERPPEGTPVTVTGWGTLVEDGDIPDRLQEVTVSLVANSQCRKSYSLLLTGRMLCAGVEEGGKDACQGDSGGPLIFNNELLGIVSWGVGCARAKYPGVYASVPDLHDWVINTVAANLPTSDFY